MNIGFVGVGRMGANMARRLKDRKFHVTAVYDTNRATATSLAGEVGCAAAQDLSEVTAASDVIFTVVTDDNAMRNIFTGSGDNLLVNARGKLFINCATISPQVHVEIEKLAQQAGAESLEA
jgi:3-hydroxyisobutyrate dehydrogenase